MTAVARKRTGARKPRRGGDARTGVSGATVAAVAPTAIFDVCTEDCLTLAQAARLPIFGKLNEDGHTYKPATAATMRLHRLEGLECVKTRQGYKTSRQAIQRYFERLSGAGRPGEPMTRSTLHQHDQATRSLEEKRI